MTKTLRVRTELGMFKRTTARTYTHIVVVKGERHEELEKFRVARLKQVAQSLVDYAAMVASANGAASITRYFGGGTSGDSYQLATSEIQGWIDGLKREQVERAAPITEDKGDWFVLGWCGREDLAWSLAQSKRADYYRQVAIFTVDGQPVGDRMGNFFNRARGGR